MLPNLLLLEQIQRRIKFIPNQRKESKRKEHYGLFLLGYKAGLRVSEAIKFDLTKKTKRGLYQVKTKGGKERLVAVSREVINELKANNWQPQQTNRFNFYHFLRKIKQELVIPNYVELTPHTLRRAFATYHAEAGLPLPLLQKLLGHSSVRTTALYWMNIYSNGDDTNDILTEKIWLEKPKKPRPKPAEVPIKVSLELPELLVLNLSLSSLSPAEYLSKISQLEEQLNQTQQENKNLKDQNKDLKQDLNNLAERSVNLQHTKNQTQRELTIAREVIQQLTQELANEQEKLIATESDLSLVKALNKDLQNNLTQAQQINNNLHQQLQTEQAKNSLLQETNANLTKELSNQEQNQTNLLNTYQIAIKAKEKAEKQVNYYKNQLKTIAKTFHQWQKINHYQQLESEQKTQIIQPPPWKPFK